MKKENVLVIEDAEEIRQILKLAIEMQGYSVIEASNGQEGLDMLENGTLPCLILLDLMMPVMDGWTFSEKISEDERLNKIPLFVVSAYSDRVKSVKHLNGFMKKPVQLSDLLKVVSTYCKK